MISFSNLGGMVIVTTMFLAAVFGRPHSVVAEEHVKFLCSDLIGGIRINSWAYQLQGIDPDRISRSSADLIVIDYSRNGTQSGAFEPQMVAKMRRKPDGSARLVLAYLSIGEAESYRFYWREQWKQPSWLGPQNPNWPGNYKVRYWDEDWQKIILGNSQSYLDKIITAGFDGVYLDIVDAFEFWKDSHPSAAADMVRFVRRIANYGRAKNRGFVIVSQNGEELLEFPQFREVIDAIAKEDLFYGIAGEGAPNTRDQIETSLRFLRLAQKANLPVLAIEYVPPGPTRAAAEEQFRTSGVIGTFGGKLLDSFVEGPPSAGKPRISGSKSGWCDS